VAQERADAHGRRRNAPMAVLARLR
jgi:hypothetical protein